MEFEIDNTLKEILNTLPDAHIVGGFVRDLVLGIEPKDVDLTTSALPSEIKKIFPENIPLGEKFGTIIIKSGDLEIEVTTMRSDITSGRQPNVSFTDCIFTDLTRRDFTINAMALDKNLNLIDVFNGVADIKNRTLRAVGDPMSRMSEDPLRALRAIRFSSQLNFKIDLSLDLAITKTNIGEVSKERIRDEFLKSIHYNPVRTIQDSMRLGIMEQIIPEFHLLETCEQYKDYHPEGDALQHTLQALQYDEKASVIEKMAILLHDIGKIHTKNNPNRFQYMGHAEIGAKLAKEILKQLKFSNGAIDEIVFSVSNHMKMHEIQNMRKSKRYALYSSEYFGTLLKVHMADKYNRGESNCDFVVNDIPEEPPIPCIDGNYLMSIGFKPSVELGHVKNKLYEMQIEYGLSKEELEEKAKIMKAGGTLYV